LSGLPEVNLTASYKQLEKRKDGKCIYRLTLNNTSDAPAFMIRVKTMNDKTKKLVLPVYYEDNYLSLMPGESKSITIEFEEKRLNKNSFSFYIEGWNIPLQKVKN
jgi:hypothetical protein